MSDFWSEFDKSYRYFSQFCDSHDWHSILTALTGAVTVSAKPNVQMRLLDIGCGNGIATETICEMIFAITGCLPLVTVVEPSKIARDRIECNILYDYDGGPLTAIHENIKDIPSDAKYDSIILLHSSYYIRNFDDQLKCLVKHHLFPNGNVSLLVLPEESPFFLQMGNLSNCAESVKTYMRRSGLHHVNVHQLQSRFRLPQSDSMTDEEWDTLSKFMRPEGIPTDEFIRRITRELHNGSHLDFQDCIVTGRVNCQ